MGKEKTYTFNWKEHHSYSVRASSPKEAQEQFYYDAKEGFGGEDTYRGTQIDHADYEVE